MSLIDLRVDCGLRFRKPGLFCLANSGVERAIEIWIKRARDDVMKRAPLQRLHRKQRVDFRLLAAEGFLPTIRALFRLFKRRRRQTEFAHLLDRERDRDQLELQLRELKITKRLQLASDTHAHLPTARVKVGQREDDKRTAVFNRVLCDQIRMCVADLAGAQIKIGFVRARDRKDDQAVEEVGRGLAG